MADRYFCLPPEYSDFENSGVLIQEAPYEGTVSYGEGTGQAPGAIRRASAEVELYDEEYDAEPCVEGIHTASPLSLPQNPEDTVNHVYQSTKSYLQHGKHIITIGGEHTITAGEIRAFKEYYPDVCVLQIDAHADLREEFEGSRYSHASVMRRVSEMDIPIVQVGIRSMSAEERDFLSSDNHRCVPFYMHRMRKADWIDDVLEQLGEQVFITIDVDGLDPSIMPATGTPEPGGLMWYELLDLLASVYERKEVVGADIVELAPISGLHAPDFTAARLLHKLITYRCARQ